MRALEIHDVARATSCVACALEMLSSNGCANVLNRAGRLIEVHMTKTTLGVVKFSVYHAKYEYKQMKVKEK